MLNELREPVITGQTRPEKWRRLQLQRMNSLLETHEKEILLALKNDLGKPATEAFFEIIALRQELKLIERKLTEWMQSKNIPVPLPLQPGKAFIKPEPLGCVLIIGPWNYPFSLTLQPLISALGAGNTAVLKPSEHASETSKLIKQLINRYFPTNVVQVIEGDGDVASNLLKHKFDHIFFTGGEKIAKKVMEAAAKNLTPITLELGGKSPALVIKGADISVTARRLVWGKGLNSGQTCIAPDHLIVQEYLKDSLIKAMKENLINFYGTEPLKSAHLGKIINKVQFERLVDLLDNAKKKGQILAGGNINYDERIITPTLIEINSNEDPLMQEELFGPLLPIICVNNLEEAIIEIRKRPKPLALYMFGGGEKEQKYISEQTSSGGICFNDVVMQAGVPELPFGGVGASGIGRYHGEAGFKTFSNQKSILKRSFFFDFKLRYPPYKIGLESLRKLLG